MPGDTAEATRLEDVIRSRAKDLAEEQRSIIEQEVSLKLRTTLEAEYTRKLNDTVKALQEDNRQMMEKVVAEWKEEQRPPDVNEVRLMLNQEYIEFTLNLNTDKGKKEFLIRELPQSIEKKFYRKVKEKLVPKIREFADITVRIAEGDVESKLMSVIEMFDPALDIVAELVAVVLDPYGKDPSITFEWVQENISSYRQWNIIVAQERVNRVRDFFLQASRTSLGGTMKGVSTQK